MNRRNFIKHLNALALWSGLGIPCIGKSANLEIDRYSFLIKIMGGWDVSLSLDPWLTPTRPSESDMFIEYRHDELINTADNKLIVGPAMNPMRALLTEVAIINGIYMADSDNGHDASLAYSVSGGGEGKYGSFSTEAYLSGHRGNLGVVGQVYSAGRSVPSIVPNTLESLFKKSNPFEVVTDFDETTALSKAKDTIRINRKKLIEAREYFLKDAPETRFSQIKDAHLVSALFRSGLSKQAELVVNESLDTHGNHVKLHLESQRKAWQIVADIFNHFRSIPMPDGSGNSLFDRTTFFVISEFSRTPYLNSAGGKDHNPLTNSCLLAGYGVKKSIKMGGSQLVDKTKSTTGLAYHIALPLDKDSEQAVLRRKNVLMLRPENIIATLADIQGLDKKFFQSVIPGIKSLETIKA